jgi:O-antigen/teichoic acid export membrane protein
MLSNSLFSSSLNTLFTLVFSFLANVFFVRIAGLELYGQYSVVLSIVTVYFSLFALGTLSSFPKEAAWYIVNRKNPSGFFTLVIFFVVLSCLLFAWPVYLTFQSHFDESYRHIDSFNTAVFILLLVNVLFYGPSMYINGIFEGNYLMKFPLRINILISVFRIFFLGLFYFSGKNILTCIVYVYLLPNLLLFISSYHVSKNILKLSFSFNNLELDFIRLKSLLKFSLKLLPLTIAELIIGNFAYFMLSGTETFENIGSFRVLFGLFVLLNTLQSFFGKSLLPVFSRFYYENNTDSAVFYFNIFWKASLLTSTIILVFIGIFSEGILNMFQAYSPRNELYLYILLAANYTMIGSFVGSLLNSFEEPWIVSKSLMLGSLTYVVILFLFGSKSGILSAVLGLFFCYFIMQFYLGWHASKKFNVNYKLLWYLFNFGVAAIFVFIVKLIQIKLDSMIVSFLLFLFWIYFFLRNFQLLKLFDSIELYRIHAFISGIQNTKVRSIVYNFAVHFRVK